MSQGISHETVIAILVLIVLLLVGCGCDSMNRKYFTSLEPMGTKSGYEYFRFRAGTGASGITCSSKSVCRVDNSRRAALWPLDDTEAEKTRMKWLETWLSEQGHQDVDYEIISRSPVMAINYSSQSVYDVCYDVRVVSRDARNAGLSRAVLASNAGETPEPFDTDIVWLDEQSGALAQK